MVDTKEMLDNLKEYKIIPHSDYSNITNYKTSNDLIFNAFELGNCNKNPGKTYIVEDNMRPINSHLNFDAIAKGAPIPAEKYMEAHSYSVQIKKFKEEQKQKIMANFKLQASMFLFLMINYKKPQRIK